MFTSHFLAASITKGRMVGSPTPGIMSSWPPNNPGDHNATLESSLCTSPTPPAHTNPSFFRLRLSLPARALLYYSSSLRSIRSCINCPPTSFSGITCSLHDLHLQGLIAACPFRCSAVCRIHLRSASSLNRYRLQSGFDHKNVCLSCSKMEHSARTKHKCSACAPDQNAPDQAPHLSPLQRSYHHLSLIIIITIPFWQIILSFLF